MATLNLHNPEGLYSGGSVSINALPYARMAMDARERKQARQDSIDKYYQQLPNTINDKGVRDQEIPIINQYRDAIFEYGLKNKDALRNPKLDNGKAQYELNKLMGQAKNVARLSQDAAKEDLEIGKLWLSKDNRWVVDDDEFIAANQRHNLPVTHPDFKKVDIPLILQGRPFDQTAFRKELKDFKYSEGAPTITPHPTDKLMEVVTSNPILGEETKQSIYNFAADKFHSNRGFRKKIETQLAGTGQLSELKSVFQKTFGRPIESDEDIAAAYTISQLPTSSTRAKVIANKDAVMDRQMAEWKLKEGIRQANRRELFGMREAAKAAGEEANDLWVESYIDKLTSDAAAGSLKGYYQNKNGVRVKDDRIQLDPVLAKVLTKDGVSPDQFAVQQDGQYRPIFYKRDKDGKVLTEKGLPVVDEIASVPMSKEQFKLVLGGKAGVKQLNKEMKGKSKSKAEFDDL